MNTQTLEQQQDGILKELAAIRAMKKGTVTRQTMRIARRGKGRGVCGPYPVLTWKEGGRTRSMRLRTSQDVEWAEQAIGAYRRFAALCREYEHLGERRALSQRPAVQSASCEAQKKGRKSPRSGRGR